MKIEQIYTGCLSQAAYYIESNGEAAIIDPLREVQQYIDMAKANNATIKYIFETHFHADFVSGHLTLAEKTGAPIVYGPKAQPSFKAVIAEDKQVFEIGDIKIKVLHTPGHTMESTTYLLQDENGKDHAIFTGDTLFLGDVGRPDLAQKANDVSIEQLAAIQYKSLRNKIMPLADDVMVYPAHGAGSACGKNMMKITLDTLGNQKAMNYALRADMTLEEFIEEVTDGLEAPPSYFPLNVKLNKEGYDSIDNIIESATNSLQPKEFLMVAEATEAIVLDVRPKEQFIKAHIPKSIFIGLEGTFAPWVGDLLKDIHVPILLVVGPDKLVEAVTRLSRVGFDNTIGYLGGGIEAWQSAGYEVDSIEQISAQQLSELDTPAIVDVRKPSEFETEHIESAKFCPLANLNLYIPTLPEEGLFYVHCASGYRSVIAASLLKARGVHNFKDVIGGFKALSETSLPRVSTDVKI